jgi:hypothetical protein
LGNKLLKAAAIGDLASVDASLLQGADVNTTYDKEILGDSLETDDEIAQCQLRSRSVNDPDYVFTVSDWLTVPLRATALILASRGGYAPVVQRLLAERDIDCNKGTREAFNMSRNNQTALHWACRLGHTEVVRLLVADERADVNAPMLTGFTPLAVTMQQGHMGVVEELFACPRVSYGWVCFQDTEEGRAFDPARREAFVTNGADMEGLKTLDCGVGMVLLFHAAGEGRFDMVRRCMKEEGIRKMFFDPQVQSMLPSFFRGCTAAVTCEHSPAILQSWLEIGVNVNVPMFDGTTALDTAVKRHMVEHIRLLLMCDAESTDMSPIQRAQLLGDAAAVQKLVREGATSPMGGLLSTAGPEECEYFLPKEIGGIAVLVPDGDGHPGTLWRAENTRLQVTAPGIAYRTRASLDAKADRILKFGDVIQGDDVGDGWVRVKCRAEAGDSLPPLHRAAVQGDSTSALAELRKEVKALGSPEAARDLLDEGQLPAAFYAVELGHLRLARELFQQVHRFPTALVKKLMDMLGKVGKGAAQGECSFQVCKTLIDQRALEDDQAREGALAFIKPLCSSLIAVRFLENADRFQELRSLCRQRGEDFYRRVDERVTVPVLQQAAHIAAGAPTAPVRQDDIGVIPPFKSFRSYHLRTPMSFDHEAMVAHAYALLGEGLADTFEAQMQQLVQGSSVRVAIAPPKSFQRMQNKLLNPFEHGDPNIPRPRCAKNVDVLRGCVVVKDVQELEAVYNKLQNTCQVLRVKNTHESSALSGYRSLLVNFLYQPGLTWSQLFGDAVTFDFDDWGGLFNKKAARFEGKQTDIGTKWLDYVEPSSSMTRLLALQALQIVASEQPNEPLRMIAELQFVLDPYYSGRAVSHIQYKIARCGTGAMEMVRDFSQEYILKQARSNKLIKELRQDAMKKSKDLN